MLGVYGHYKYFYSCSAGIDFRRLKSIPALIGFRFLVVFVGGPLGFNLILLTNFRQTSLFTRATKWGKKVLFNRPVILNRALSLGVYFCIPILLSFSMESLP